MCNSNNERDISMDNNDTTTDEVSLVDLVAVLWQWKKLIIGLTTLISIVTFIFLFVTKKLPPEKSFLPDAYTSTAFMRIQSRNKSSGSTLASILQQSNLGGLAGLTGGVENTNAQLALYIAGSNSFLDAISEKFNIVKKYEVKKFPKYSSRKIIKDFLKIKMDDKSGVFSIAVTHIEPEFAQQVALFAVQYYEARFAELGLDSKLKEKENLEKSLNQSFDEIKRLEHEASNLEKQIARSGLIQGIAPAIERIKREIVVQEKIYSQLKVQYEVLKVEMAGERPTFQVLDYPEVSEIKSSPPRAKICIIAFIVGLFFSIFLAFLLNSLQEMRAEFTNRVEAKKGVQDEK